MIQRFAYASEIFRKIVNTHIINAFEFESYKTLNIILGTDSKALKSFTCVRVLDRYQPIKIFHDFLSGSRLREFLQYNSDYISNKKDFLFN